MELNFEKIANSVNDNGFYLIENYLSNDDLLNIIKALDIKNQKEDKDSKLKFGKKDFYDDFINLKFAKIKKKLHLIKLNQKYKLNQIANKIYGKNINYTADFYLSKISDEMVIPWHTDQAYRGRKDVTRSEINKNNYLDPEKAALKFFFYLTDVDSENGCLAYIPKSNLISYHLKNLIYKNKIEYSPFWHLNDYRNLIQKKEIRELLEEFIEKDVIEEFCSNTSFILNKGDTKKFDLPCKAGSMLIFSELGVHRGSAITKQDRIALRYFYKKN